MSCLLNMLRDIESAPNKSTAPHFLKFGCKSFPSCSSRKEDWGHPIYNDPNIMKKAHKCLKMHGGSRAPCDSGLPIHLFVPFRRN
ncbi:hypothetical protein ES288_A10G114400v1 [Gossypium darwinii]|uniref:Uncharacterized protein n=1 Tax=Gossypium darwinii TaxID=34276 RepID=A0A5D2EYS0_GOSDA|nr:hypothetical protein ES288_A10G114400v1 [Gossypium darwinii]